MRTAVKRALSALSVAALALGGVALGATSAQALPGSVTFAEQNCDIPTGGTPAASVDGADLTISNATTDPAELDYSIVLDFRYDDPYETGTVAAGDSERVVIPLPEGSSTTIQVFDTATGEGAGTLIGGSLVDVDCTPDYSPEAVATISDSSCAFPSGGIIPPSPGFSFTLDNSKGTGPAAYSFVAGDVDVESGTVAAGDTRVRSWSLEEDTPLVATIGSVDADGEPVVLATKTELVNCEADAPTIVKPTQGQTVTSPVTVSGTGTAGDRIAVLVSDPAIAGPLVIPPAALSAPGFTAQLAPTEPAVTGDGYVIYQTDVTAEGTFAISAALVPANYQTVALAARPGNEEGTVPPSVSDPSAIVDFVVVAAPTPTPTPTPSPAVIVPAGKPGGGSGTLANTGSAPLIAGGGALALLAAGGIALALRRRQAVR